MTQGAQLLTPVFDTGTGKLFIGDGNDFHDLLNPEECQDVRDYLQGVAGPVEEITFITNPGPQADIGALYWDAEYKTLALNVGVPGVTLQLGQETHLLCINNTGAQLLAGTVVFIDGSNGEHPTIAKAVNTNYAQSNSVMGILTSSPLQGEHCMVTVHGIVHEINTAAYAPGTMVYVSDTAGVWTATKPTTDKTSARIGYVVKQNATDGEVFVDKQIEMNSAGMAIDAQLRTASTELPTTPTVFVWPTEIVDTIGSYNNTTGVITLQFSGDFSFNFLYNSQTSGSAKQLYSAAQIWNGSTWVAAEFSTRQISVAQNIKTLATFVSTNPFAAGTQLRFVTWASAAGLNLVTESPSAGYTIPAARLMVTGVKTI